MRVLLQRVQHASVRVDGAITGSIQQGFLLLVGITPSDTEDIMRKMAGKCAQLRVFEDENGKMNRGLQDIGGSILSISQFTLYADCKREDARDLKKRHAGILHSRCTMHLMKSCVLMVSMWKRGSLVRI